VRPVSPLEDPLVNPPEVAPPEDPLDEPDEPDEVASLPPIDAPLDELPP
jgi:hypothetical protein